MNEFLKANLAQLLVAGLMMVGLYLTIQSNHDEVVRSLAKIDVLETRVTELDVHLKELSDDVSSYQQTGIAKDAEHDVRIGYLEMGK